jgi:hypothetical protein
MNAIAMLRSHHDRSGYTRLDNMVDLERRLVRKLGTSDHPSDPHVAHLTNRRLLHTGGEKISIDIMAADGIPGVLLRCILFQLP